MRFFIYLLFGALFFLTTPADAFFALTWDELMYQMEKRMSWRKAKMETIVQVFDPFAKNVDGEFTKIPVELPARGFKQIIHWKDGEILVVETMDEKEQLLHYYYENKGDLLSVSLDDNRTLETEDILPHQLRFRSRFEEDRNRALEETGVIYKSIAYHISNDNNVFLRIGNIESGHFALLNPKTYDLISIHNRFLLENEDWLELKIVFKNYEIYRWQTFPKVTEYFIGNRLFKRVRVSNVRTLSRLPIKILREKAWKLRNLQHASLKIDYAL